MEGIKWLDELYVQALNHSLSPMSVFGSALHTITLAQEFESDEFHQQTREHTKEHTKDRRPNKTGSNQVQCDYGTESRPREPTTGKS